MLPWALHQTVLGVSRAWPEYTWLCAGSVGHQAHLEGFSLPGYFLTCLSAVSSGSE